MSQESSMSAFTICVRVPAPNVAARDRSDEDRETWRCSACDCGLTAVMEAPSQSVRLSHKARRSFPCPTSDCLKGSARFYWRTWPIDDSLLLLCAVTKTCSVCPCLPLTVRDTFETLSTSFTLNWFILMFYLIVCASSHLRLCTSSPVHHSASIIRLPFDSTIIPN